MLLRLVLSLGLILNGSGYASAAAMLHVANAAPAAVVSDTPQAENTAPCPEHGAVTTSAEVETAASSASHDPGQREHGKPGCCGAAGCIATCLQHAPAAIVAPWFGPAVPVHSVSIGWTDAAHASPALPDRIRPPIA